MILNFQHFILPSFSGAVILIIFMTFHHCRRSYVKKVNCIKLERSPYLIEALLHYTRQIQQQIPFYYTLFALTRESESCAITKSSTLSWHCTNKTLLYTSERHQFIVYFAESHTRRKGGDKPEGAARLQQPLSSVEQHKHQPLPRQQADNSERKSSGDSPSDDVSADAFGTGCQRRQPQPFDTLAKGSSPVQQPSRVRNGDHWLPKWRFHPRQSSG